MSEHFISRADAEGDLLACAAYIAESIPSGEAHAEAISAVVSLYLERNNVDLAAELANSIDDPFTRDRLLIAVSAKSAELNDDEYSLQLADAIEEQGFQAQAFERIGILKANAGELDKAREVAAMMDYPDSILASIAVKEALDGDVANAFKTIDEIEYAGSAVSALNSIASQKIKEENTASVDVLLDRSVRQAFDIEHDEERIRALVEIGNLHIEAGKPGSAIETFEKARLEAEALDNVHRDVFLAQVSLGFLRAGSVDLADRTLDAVVDKTQIASVLLGFARDYWNKDEHDEAFEALDEAHEILRSQKEIETRDSKAKFGLFSQLAIQYAGFEKGEKALEIAEPIPDDAQRTAALGRIAQIGVTQGNEAISDLALNAISEVHDRAVASIGMSAAASEINENEKAGELLKKAAELASTVPQPSLRATIFAEIARRYQDLGDTINFRSAAHKCVETIGVIRDRNQCVSALCELLRSIENADEVLDEVTKNIVRSLIEAPAI